MRAPRSTHTAMGAVAALGFAGLLVVAGCGSSSKTASTSGTQAGAASGGASSASSAPTTAASAAPTTAAAGGATSGSGSTLATGSTSLGTLVVNSSGRTLYVFDKDTAGAQTSACTGSCATTWPAATVTGSPTKASGVGGTVGEIMRTDGTAQVTLNGRPLYLFSGDQAAGDTHGNGIGGIWHAVQASGAPVASASTSPSTSPSTTAKSSSGYGY